MKNSYFYASLLTLSLLFGCVTINIYFPAAAAEKAADKIIEEVWQLKKPEDGAQSTPGAPGMDGPIPSQPIPQPGQPMQPTQPTQPQN
ncbi:hypothetical protein SAMN05216315_102119 [Nitrosospira sp. Nsp18]|uniref:hypothetical protein n=1 Tax=Nitrosospira sp. Nsp18 TaxID=1855334 RepID=UPI0008851B2E|nr:hypothetical protein [Nitrosospira sp. Nsp18]SDA11104.1 hypothetical protein SAMN05216315_102119 [Nitrosospira sp. Nsp18]